MSNDGKARANRGQASSQSILIVDDQPFFRKSLKESLEQAGFYDLSQASSGSEAQEVLGKRPFDMLICDLFMPNGSGFELIQFVRQEHHQSDLPILVVSGEASKSEIVRAIDFGATAYVLKPIDRKSFLLQIEKIFAKLQKEQRHLSLLAIGDRFFFDKSWSKAYKAYHQAFKEQAQASHRTIYCLGRVLLKLGSPKQALKFLDSHVPSDTQYFRFYRLYADIYASLGQGEEQAASLEKELAINASNQSSTFALARLYQSQHNYERSVEVYREGLKLNPKSYSGLLGMAQCCHALKQRDKAIYYAKRIRRNFPRDEKSIEVLADVMSQLGKMEAFASYLKDEWTQKKGELHAGLALVEVYLSEPAQVELAEQWVERLLVSFADSPRALKKAAEVYLQSGKSFEALKVIQEWWRVEPIADVLILKARVQRNQKRLDAATKTWLKIAGRWSELRGRAYREMIDLQKKQQAWSKAIFLTKIVRQQVAAKGSRVSLEELKSCRSQRRHCIATKETA